MSKRQSASTPASLPMARRRFEQWRNKNRPRSRYPEELWSTAVELAREHGIHKTARSLRLDYYSLKKKLDAAAEAEKTPDFIEILPAAMPPCPECTIELENGSAKMRIHVKAAQLPDLAAITSVFRRNE